MKTSNHSSSSPSPPTPPSPLPISVGPRNNKYSFLPSPSPSPPFSLPLRSSSGETIPLLQRRWPPERPKELSAFSLDKLLATESSPPGIWHHLKGCLEWLMLRFCCYCSSFS